MVLAIGCIYLAWAGARAFNMYFYMTNFTHGMTAVAFAILESLAWPARYLIRINKKLERWMLE